MIKLDLTVAITVFLISDVLLVMALWLAYTCNERGSKDDRDAQFVQQCPYCSYVFFDYQKKSLQSCPQCKSLIDR